MFVVSSDVIVVGAGVMGTSAALHLAKAGARVRLFEQFSIGHAMGSSHGASRIIRLAYPEPEYVRLAQAAFAMWRDLEAESGERLLYRTGGLDFGAPDALGLAEIGANYRALGVEFEALSGAEITRRYPQIRPPAGSIGFFQPDYSMLAADLCVRTAASQAQRNGAQLHENEGVRRISVQSDSVTVHTDRGDYHAARLVLASGSWVLPQLRALGVNLPLVVTKEQVLHMAAHTPADFEIGRFPLFIHRFAGTTVLGSGFPLLGHRAPKFIYDRIGVVVEPGDPDRAIDQKNLEIARNYALGVIDGLTGDVDEVISCRYTMTPDEHFVIDTHPQHAHVVIASPCSGHGFKFGSVIGQILSDLAMRGATAHDISLFKLARFGGLT